MNDIEAERRKRIERIKSFLRISRTVATILPIVLCIILFIRLAFVSNEIKELKASVDRLSRALENGTYADDVEAGNSPGKSGDDINNEDPSGKDTGEAETDGSDSNETDPIETDRSDSHQDESQSEEESTGETTVSDDGRITEADRAEGQKVVYLTFDDGPCENTMTLLDTLDQYNAKATFFVNYHEGFENEYKSILERGHTLGMHTWSHDYKIVYNSVEDFTKEVMNIHDYIQDLTGYDSRYFRFPGGSSNSQTVIPITNYIDYLGSVGIRYYDWNVSSGDGGSTLLTKEQVYNNVITGIQNNDVSIVLMHDATYKPTTLEAIPSILQTLNDMNALVLPITQSSSQIHHSVE